MIKIKKNKLKFLIKWSQLYSVLIAFQISNHKLLIVNISEIVMVQIEICCCINLQVKSVRPYTVYTSTCPSV